MTRRISNKWQIGLLVGALAITLAVACGATATPTPAPAATPPPVADEGQDEVMAILATTLLDVGPQRLAFLLTTPKGLIKDADVSVTPVYLDEDAVGEPMH